jgi:drug/metabolite transporter (DMT)-like permease
MTPFVVAMVLLAAVLHAAWNAILRGGEDRLWSMTVICAGGGLIAAPFAAGLPRPEPASWGCLGLSVALEIAYCLFLVRAYRHGQLAHVYPIARGSAPLLVTVGAAVFAGERLGAAGLVSVSLVSAGILILVLGRDRPDARTAIAALITGCLIAGYMVTDGVGGRLSHHAVAYAAWEAVGQGAAMLVTYWAVRRRPPAFPRGPAGAKVMAAALIGVLSYGVVVWAMSVSPMGKVSALRETSILFAALIGAVWLREPLTLGRLVGGATIAAGAIGLSAL